MKAPDFAVISSSAHYAADACIAWCFDDRFSPALEAFKKSRFAHSDVIESAGGAKALAGGPSPERDFVLNQIKASLRLHKTPLIVLMLHLDCGGYGGSAAFGNDLDAEFRHHQEDLQKASDFLLAEISGITVECWIAGFDGLYRV